MTEPQAAPNLAPISAEELPPQFRKHVDPATPVKLRMMAAKALIPMPSLDQVKSLFILSYDPDETVAATATASAGSLPDKILTPSLRGDLPAVVLDFLARQLADKPEYVELILLNPATGDDTFARLAQVVDDRLLGIVADNQLRLLRSPDIIRALHQNPGVSAAALDRVVDFAVRSGLNLPDLPSFKEARRRILGEEAERALDPEETADGLMAAHRSELEEDHEEELAEERRLTITQMIMRMSISEKIKLASMGNKEARTILLRDANKLVQEAAIVSPRITEGEVIMLTNSRTIPDGVLRVILVNRDWMKNYQVKVNLVNNPKLPLPTALRLLPHLRPNDLKNLARNRNVANALSTQAKTLLERKSSG